MQAVLECKQCGAQLEVLDNQKIVQCKFCGSANAVSFIDRMGLYNRANYLRRQNEFDRAISVYEDILKEDAHDAEAYYGIALCKYGIEYVDDPNGKGKMPTCHRTRYTPISQDIDFKKAIENADDDTAMLYAEEAGKIDRILLKIQALSNKHEKYDVFICYKEGDGIGGRTQTSVFAQDIYQELVRQGYKVFFARKTLETKLGSDYEPIIFAALFSAKVMLVVGTKPEEFQGVWVRNEWTRYRERMANGEACALIPLYRDMSPYELPQEFANLQALDMGKIGFMQDLSDGLAKLIRKDTTANVAPSKANVIDDIGNVNLKKRARLELEQGNFSGAATYIERALDKEPEDAESYIMKVQISRGCRSEEELGEGLDSLESDNNYQLALRFALPDALERYKSYEELIQQRLLEIEKAEEEARIRKEKEDAEYRRKKEQKIALRIKIMNRVAISLLIIVIIVIGIVGLINFIKIKKIIPNMIKNREYVAAEELLINEIDDYMSTGLNYESAAERVEKKYGFSIISLNEHFTNEVMKKNMSEEEWNSLAVLEEYSSFNMHYLIGLTSEGKFVYRDCGWYYSANDYDFHIKLDDFYRGNKDVKFKKIVMGIPASFYALTEDGKIVAFGDPETKRHGELQAGADWYELEDIKFLRGTFLLGLEKDGIIRYEVMWSPERIQDISLDLTGVAWEEINESTIGDYYVYH